MAEVRSTPTPPVESSSRWDFLKKPINRLLRRESQASQPHLEKREYEYAGNKVEVGFVKFDGSENQKKYDPTQAAFLLTGFPMRADAQITWGQPKIMADKFGTTTYEIDGRPKGTFNINSTALEVEGIRQFISEVERDGVREVTLFGHSLGATKAVDLAVSLEQQNPNLKTNLILINPVGMYAKDFKQIAKDYMFEAPKIEANTRNQNRTDQPMIGVLKDIFKSIYSDIKATKLRYPRFFADQRQALTEFNTNLGKVKSPVLVMLASEDPVVELDKVLPSPEVNKITPQALQDETGRARMARMGKAREQYLKENIFPQAADVKVIIATKYANHNAFGVERPRQTSHVISGFFDRLRRPQAPNPPAANAA